tara:strand:+ start:277 stop:789 length:513 start_codon:yes stop_codon:yes gene_type:complete
MLLVKTTSNGQVEQFPYTLGDLRRENPNTSYPKKIGDAILADNLIFHVMHETLPEYDSLVQSLVRDAAPVKEVRTKQPEDEFLADVAVGDTYETGRWVIGYTVENKPQDQAEAAIRNQRDHLLSDTDWMALNDSPAITTDWAAYRQALRDITGQAGFPNTVTWPTKPGGL